MNKTVAMEVTEAASIISVIRTGPREHHREVVKEPRVHGGPGNTEEKMEPMEGTDCLAKAANPGELEVVAHTSTAMIIYYGEMTPMKILEKGGVEVMEERVALVQEEVLVVCTEKELGKNNQIGNFYKAVANEER